MGFTDKALAPVTAQINAVAHSVDERMEVMSNQIAGIALLGMVAFTLISAVAVAALVKASK